MNSNDQLENILQQSQLYQFNTQVFENIQYEENINNDYDQDDSLQIENQSQGYLYNECQEQSTRDSNSQQENSDVRDSGHPQLHHNYNDYQIGEPNGYLGSVESQEDQNNLIEQEKEDLLILQNDQDQIKQNDNKQPKQQQGFMKRSLDFILYYIIFIIER